MVQSWFMHQPAVFGPVLVKLVANRLHYNFAVYWIIVCAWHAWNYYQDLREREQHAAELAAQLAHAQLQSLRMQLNPHFLFNTLNAVSSLMLKDVKAANAMIARLAELLRYALDNSQQQEISLRQELDFVRRYLDIQKIRFGNRLELKLEIDPTTLDLPVPNMILQPLVENAIEHAVGPRESAGRIEFQSSTEQKWLVLSVSDNGSGEPAVSPIAERIGLGTSRERLRKLYGDEQRIDLLENAMGGLTARVFLPLRAGPVAA
jgi:LytS/YehU family sensor histidine kinase